MIRDQLWTPRRGVASRAGLIAVSTALAVLLVPTAGHSAGASAPGELAWAPGRGTDETPIEVVTTGGCPAPATNVVGVLHGKGFPASGQSVIGNTDAGVSSTGPFRLALADTVRAFARMQDRPFELSGDYRLVVSCREALDPRSHRDYVGTVTFTAPSRYVAVQPKVMPSPAAEPAGVPAPIRSDPAGPPAVAGPETSTASVDESSAAAFESLAPKAASRRPDPADGPGLLGVGLLAAACFAGGVVTLTALQRRTARRTPPVRRSSNDRRSS